MDDLTKGFNRSKERLAKLLEMNAPDVILANECRIFLKRYNILASKKHELEGKEILKEFVLESTTECLEQLDILLGGSRNTWRPSLSLAHPESCFVLNKQEFSIGNHVVIYKNDPTHFVIENEMGIELARFDIDSRLE